MSEHLSADFWSERYITEQTGWDLGAVSPPLKAYFDQLEDRSLRILIPGCGNGYEAEYLLKSGFENVHVIDLSQFPLQNLQERCPGFPRAHLHQGDFFEHQNTYDLIVEQTMFCAIDPTLRAAYANQVHSLLAENGKLVGVLFDKFFESGPPYGGDKQEYLTYFTQFSSVEMEPCYNSAAPRQGSELFVKFIR